MEGTHHTHSQRKRQQNYRINIVRDVKKSIVSTRRDIRLLNSPTVKDQRDT